MKATTKIALTRGQSFHRFRVVPEGEPYTAEFDLLEVRAGVPVMEALTQASCFIDTAQHMASMLGENIEDACYGASAYGIAFLLEQAKALVDAATGGVLDAQGSNGTASVAA